MLQAEASALRADLSRARGEANRPPGTLSRAEEQYQNSQGAIAALHTEVSGRTLMNRVYFTMLGARRSFLLTPLCAVCACMQV